MNNRRSTAVMVSLVQRPTLWLLIAPVFLLIAGLLAAKVVKVGPVTKPPAVPMSAGPQPSTAFFAPGHTEADARTLAAMVRYLVSPEAPLPLTNQAPVKG